MDTQTLALQARQAQGQSADSARGRVHRVRRGPGAAGKPRLPHIGPHKDNSSAVACASRPASFEGGELLCPGKVGAPRELRLEQGQRAVPRGKQGHGSAT